MKTVIAQDAVRQRLDDMLAADRVPHAMLFCGPEGCGKLAMAIDFAQRLVSYNADERGQRMAQALQHPDLHFVFPVYKPDGQSSNPTSDFFLREWRALLDSTHYFDLATWTASIARDAKRVQIYTEESEAILHKLSLVSSQGGYKVMVIWLPELMHTACSNKILKILEEPPQQTVFILVSNHPEQLLDTIISRCQRLDFKALTETQIAQALTDHRGLDADTARFVAHSAAGSLTRALLQLTANTDETEFFMLFILLMRKCYQRDIKEMRAWSEQLAAWGRERQKAFLEYCQRMIRENFMYNFYRPELTFMTRDESEFAVKFARFINERNVLGIMDELSQAQRDIEQNVNSRMVFFDFALKLTVFIKE